ncbi:LuxR C-terminal-related transcriptional regulator [Dyella japonica]|nr:response regulator transcription factor [Dyella japonica]
MDTGLGPTLIVEDDLPTLRRIGALLCTLDVPPEWHTAGSIAQAREVCCARPELRTVLIDIGLPDGNGIALIAWLHEHRPDITCVVISAWRDEVQVLAALRAGASGYLLKERDDEELRVALQSMARGGAPIDPFVARGILALIARFDDTPTTPAQPSDQTARGRISPREAEILQWVARGYSNREIADETGLSRLTIESYTKAIYRKLAVRSRTAAVFEARVRGLLS